MNGMSKDTIYRQDAIDALADYIRNMDKVYSTGKLSEHDCKDAAWSVLGELPSAEPKTCAYWDGESNICALHRPAASTFDDGFCSYADSYAERRENEQI